MTRDCLEPGSAFGRVVSSVADSEGFTAITGTFEEGDDFFAAFDMRSSVRLTQRRAAPPKPRVGHEASGAGSLCAFRARVSTVPLQSRSNASRFWIMLLLSSGAFEHGVIEQLTAQNSDPSIPITPDHSHKAVDGAVHPPEQY